MRFSLSEAFSKFFFEHKIIEIAEVFSSEEIDQITQKIEKSFSFGLGKKPIEICSNEELWKVGRNPHLIERNLLEILFKSPVGQIAAFLYKKNAIRIGYTQAIFSLKTDNFFSKNYSLEEISSVDPILGGALLSFESSKEAPSKLMPDLKKQSKGNAFFFSKDYEIPFPHLLQEQGQKSLLLCFTPAKTRYKLQPLDLHTHTLKKSSYVFGDLIEEKDCPFLHR
jgi:hypothetical protein